MTASRLTEPMRREIAGALQDLLKARLASAVQPGRSKSENVASLSQALDDEKLAKLAAALEWPPDPEAAAPIEKLLKSWLKRPAPDARQAARLAGCHPQDILQAVQRLAPQTGASAPEDDAPETPGGARSTPTALQWMGIGISVLLAVFLLCGGGFILGRATGGMPTPTGTQAIAVNPTIPPSAASQTQTVTGTMTVTTTAVEPSAKITPTEATPTLPATSPQSPTVTGTMTVTTTAVEPSATITPTEATPTAPIVEASLDFSDACGEPPVLDPKETNTWLWTCTMTNTGRAPLELGVVISPAQGRSSTAAYFSDTYQVRFKPDISQDVLIFKQKTGTVEDPIRLDKLEAGSQVTIQAIIICRATKCDQPLTVWLSVIELGAQWQKDFVIQNPLEAAATPTPSPTASPTEIVTPTETLTATSPAAAPLVDPAWAGQIGVDFSASPSSFFTCTITNTNRVSVTLAISYTPFTVTNGWNVYITAPPDLAKNQLQPDDEGFVTLSPLGPNQSIQIRLYYFCLKNICEKITVEMGIWLEDRQTPVYQWKQDIQFQ